MDLKKPNLREYERLEGEKISDSLKKFSIDSGLGEKIAASVVDFSPKGIRLHVKEKKTNMHSREVILLYPARESMTLAGEIIHIFLDGKGGEYLGILLLPTKSRERYREIIG
jgi:hypothetical protein